MNETTDETTGAPRNEAINAVCSVCKWTNTGLLNLGVVGTPRWVCHSCCVMLASERDAFRDALCKLREHATEGWTMTFEQGDASLPVAIYIDTVLAAHGDGAATAPKRDVPTHAELFNALELAWGLIANASGGDWTKESREWQDAAARWRDEQFYVLIRRFGGHAQARLGACNAPDDETGFTTFGTPKWKLLCGCSADANDNRVWCSLHGQARFGVQGTPDEAKRLRELLERCLPVLKHRAVDGSSEAEALVGEVQGALEGGATRREAREQFERWAKEGDADCCGLPGHGPLGALECPEHSKAARPRVTRHDGDCTWYASLTNGSSMDGICTCGYGWTVFVDSGGVDQSQLYSQERIVAMCVKVHPLRSRPDDSGAWASDADHDGLALAERAWRGKVEALRADVARLRDALQRVSRAAIAATAHDTGVAASGKERAS